MPDAREFNRRLMFQRRQESPDGYGNTLGEWATLCTRWVSLKPTKGGEQIQAARLQGQASWDCWARRDTWTAQVTPEDRAVDAANGELIFNIRFGPADMDGKKEWLFLQLQSGTADG